MWKFGCVCLVASFVAIAGNRAEGVEAFLEKEIFAHDDLQEATDTKQAEGVASRTMTIRDQVASLQRQVAQLKQENSELQKLRKENEETKSELQKLRKENAKLRSNAGDAFIEEVATGAQMYNNGSMMQMKDSTQSITLSAALGVWLTAEAFCGAHNSIAVYITNFVRALKDCRADTWSKCVHGILQVSNCGTMVSGVVEAGGCVLQWFKARREQQIAEGGGGDVEIQRAIDGNTPLTPDLAQGIGFMRDDYEARIAAAMLEGKPCSEADIEAKKVAIRAKILALNREEAWFTEWGGWLVTA